MKKNLLSAFAVLIMSFIAFSSGSSNNDSSKKSEEVNSSDSKDGDKWTYNEDEDKMEGTKTYYAKLISTNNVEFQFPYNGGSKLEIAVRNLNKKNEILLSISKGQFMPNFTNQYKAKIKFDDSKPISYGYNTPSDGSHDVIFLDSSKSILEKLKKSKKVMIELTFFNEGNQVFEFDSEGLKWDK